MAISKGAVIGIVVGVIVLIIVIVVVVVILLLRRKRSSGSGSSVPGTSCTGDADCPSTMVCNTQMKICVECKDDSSCSGDKSKCKVSTGKCVACVSDNNCFVGETCNSDRCCNNVSPLITGVVSTVSNNNRLDISFDFLQGTTATDAIVVIEDPATGYPLFYDRVCVDKPTTTCATAPDCPAGDICDGSTCKLLGCLSFPLNTANQAATVSVIESLLGINFYPGKSYQVKVKIVYTCGTLNNVATDFSDSVTHVFGACPDNPTVQNLSIVQIPFVGPGLGAAVPPELTVGESFPIVLIGTNAPGLHPSFGVRSDTITVVANGEDYVPITIPFEFRPLFVRAQKQGTASQCSGPVGNEVEIDFPWPPA